MSLEVAIWMDKAKIGPVFSGLKFSSLAHAKIQMSQVKLPCKDKILTKEPSQAIQGWAKFNPIFFS